jgi:transcriptional regulator with XRE-family HTH domain
MQLTPVPDARNLADAVEIEVASRLAAARKLAGLTQSALSRLVGLSFQQIHKYERGRARVSIGNLVVFARALNLPPGALFDDSVRDDGLRGLVKDPQAVALIRAFSSISDAAVRQRIVDLTVTLAPGGRA